MVKDLTVVKWNKGYYKLLDTLQNKAGESMGKLFQIRASNTLCKINCSRNISPCSKMIIILDRRDKLAYISRLEDVQGVF